MNRRQTIPRQWLIIGELRAEDEQAVRRLARGSGILVVVHLGPMQQRRLCRLAQPRGLKVAGESRRSARRVHNVRELRDALLQRVPLILLSPIRPTRSHPDWAPLPRMRAAALARLGRRRLIALGGMDARQYTRIKELGFEGWAGVSAFRT